MRGLLIGIAALILGFGAAASAETIEDAAPEFELVMLEQKACYYCEDWHAVIGPIYPKTEEGKVAPLRTVDIHGPWPADLANVSSDHFTPTFILVRQGEEVGRMRGYVSEDFFWGLLAEMIEDASAMPTDVKPGS